MGRPAQTGYLARDAFAPDRLASPVPPRLAERGLPDQLRWQGPAGADQPAPDGAEHRLAAA